MKKFRLLVVPLMAMSFLVSCGNASSNSSKVLDSNNKWYEHKDWWNYCDDATSGDIGRVVPVEVDGLTHKVRLIGINHDFIADGDIGHPIAHCTFEFANLITAKIEPEYWWQETRYEAVTVEWERDRSTGNGNFPNSTLNNFLNIGNLNVGNTHGKCILERLPEGLQGAIKNVRKLVGTGKQYELTTYVTKLFPLARDEIDKSHSSLAPNGEGRIYEFYKNNSDASFRRKTAINTSVHNYWLRSPYAYDGNFDGGANYVDRRGSVEEYTIDIDVPVAPAFCI